MGGCAHKAGTAGPLRIVLAMICVLLVVLLGTVQAVHIHADGTDTHANCSLCATAHVAVQLAQTPAPAAVLHLMARTEMLPPAVLRSRLTAFSHFTRPPPVQALPA